MISEIPQAEKEVQRYRIQDMLRVAQNSVWSNRRFPSAHMPDVPYLRRNILIDESPEQIFQLHPNLRPEIAAMHEEAIGERDSVDAVKKVAMYEPEPRKIIFFQKALGLNDEELRRVVYHEAATDTVGRETIITPAEYSEVESDFISHALPVLFPEGYGVQIGRTNILKLGFRRLIEVDGFVAGELPSPELDVVDEIYPTAFELITDQILRRGGDVRLFDKDARERNVQLQGQYLDTNNSFASVLFEVMRLVDWRDILTAFNTGDVDEVVAHLAQVIDRRVMAEGIFMELCRAMRDDEDRTFLLNSITGFK